MRTSLTFIFFFFQAEDGIRDLYVTGVQTCALPISERDEGEAGPHHDQGQGAGTDAGRDQAVGHGVRLLVQLRERELLPPGPRGGRSEERRVGKECRSRWWAYSQNKKR